ncbi:uncharacterized protein RCC_12039 [Ramularia collo-cygni]|uniref:F-box domain-containing protein n=1 Tax=Ramularia collo-cygni TaxID=112498 RepID=A0A2D3UT81_9PEZI|nr:uncharacterized protein RCC_12039 [Ramularia collo-cygni]CZT14997.1 uncharacterized protein RCC_12039 [Ramularia collo-cygni]
MPYTRSMALAARTAAPAASRDDAASAAQPAKEAFPLLALPYELRAMIFEHATRDGPVLVRNNRKAPFQLASPFSGVNRQIQAELQPIVERLTPTSWRQAGKITVDVYNLNFDTLFDFLDALTRQEIQDYRRLGTVITPRLRFGRCSRRYRSRRQIREEDMESLVDWLETSMTQTEEWSGISDWKCEFVVNKPETTLIPWLRALDKFSDDVYFSPSRAMTRPGKLRLRQAIQKIVDTGVDVLHRSNLVLYETQAGDEERY